MLAQAGQHFTRCNGGVVPFSQLGMAFKVIGVQWLFNPGEVKLLKGAAGTHGFGAVPLLVGVHHQRKALTQQLANLAHALNIGGQIRLADLDLDPADATGLVHGHVVQHLLNRHVQVTT